MKVFFETNASSNVLGTSSGDFAAAEPRAMISAAAVVFMIRYDWGVGDNKK